MNSFTAYFGSGRLVSTLCHLMWHPFTGNTNNVAEVVVEVTDSTANVSLQWLHQPPVYPDLIQVFCSANLSRRDIDLRGNTSDVQGKVTIMELKPNVTYYYKLEVSGDQSFAVHGNFTTILLGRSMLQYVALLKRVILRICLQHSEHRRYWGTPQLTKHS